MRSARSTAPRRTDSIELALATYGAAGIALLTSAVLTRAMEPSEFGAYRFVLAVIALGAVVINVGIPFSAARLLAQQEATSHPRVVAASVQLILTAVTVGSFILAIFALATSEVLPVSRLLLLAAGLLWTTALQRHFMYMLRGVGRPREIAVQTLLPPTLILGLSVVVAQSVSALPLVLVLLLVGFAYLTTDFWTMYRLRALGHRRLQKERSDLLSMQRTTGLPIYKGSLVSVGVAETIVVAGGAAVGTRAFGEFSLAMSLAAPVATLPTVIGMVQYRSFEHSGGISRRQFASTSLQSSVFGLVAVSVGWFAFPYIFPATFGEARLMFPALAVGFLLHGLGDYLNQFMQAQSGGGANIKRAAYVVGVLSASVALVAIPVCGVWGLVLAKLATSVLYAAAMLFLIWRTGRAVS